MKTENLSQLNPVYSDELSSRAYAVYLPAVSTPYVNDISREPSIERAKSLPHALPNGIEGLNFLNPDNGNFYYKWALHSAGHADLSNRSPKKERIIRERDRSTSFVLGDSGGYQIAVGRKGWQVANLSDDEVNEIRLRSLRWQEENCDAVMILDYPTVAITPKNLKSGKQFLTFEECLQGTIKSIDFFKVNRRRDNPVPILNVLQGQTWKEQQYWYETVSKLHAFEGWAFSFGSHKTTETILRRLAIMLDDKMLDNCRYIHFLGVTRLRYAMALTLIARKLREVVRPDLLLTFDASNPFVLGGTHGQAYQIWKLIPKSDRLEMAWEMDQISRDIGFIGSTVPFPYVSSPIGRSITYGDLCNRVGKRGSAWDSFSAILISNHNLYVHIMGMFQANRLLDAALRGGTRSDLPMQFSAFQKVVDKAFGPGMSLQERVKVILDNNQVLEFFDRKRTLN